MSVYAKPLYYVYTMLRVMDMNRICWETRQCQTQGFSASIIHKTRTMCYLCDIPSGHAVWQVPNSCAFCDACCPVVSPLLPHCHVGSRCLPSPLPQCSGPQTMLLCSHCQFSTSKSGKFLVEISSYNMQCVTHFPCGFSSAHVTASTMKSIAHRGFSVTLYTECIITTANTQSEPTILRTTGTLACHTKTTRSVDVIQLVVHLSVALSFYLLWPHCWEPPFHYTLKCCWSLRMLRQMRQK